MGIEKLKIAYKTQK